jgi:NADP-dependent 3-hydroxy acid dehydrogenase YdfG
MDHRTALITGAGSGMGQAIAVDLAAAGLRVALIGRDEAKLHETIGKLGKNASSALAISCDVGDRAQVGEAVKKTLATFGSIDVLVCNAGINVNPRSLEALSPADWDRMIATNLTGAYNLVHFTLPSMRERKHGLVIQVCSIAGVRASLLGGAGYTASKFGQAGLGMTLGREERVHGIKSTVIYPGEVNTPILEKRPVPVPAERRAAILQSEDVAAAVRFVAELPSRATVPELVITPAADDFY